MTSISERIYSRLPVWLQNVAVSYQGWKYNRRRYGKSYNASVNDLMRTQWLSDEKLRNLQITELQKMIREVKENVPYYRRIFGEISQSVENIALDSLSKIPLVEKSQIRTNMEDFINKSRLRYGWEEGHTSGTSGIPLVFPYDLASFQRNLSFRERQYRWGGLTGREKSARFSGRILLGKHRVAPYWRFNAGENQWLFSSYHITEETLPCYYEALKMLDVAYLDGYPSSIFNVARWIHEKGLSGSWRPWAVFTTGETLLDHHRSVIEEAFGCKVFNFYSSSEGAPFITQCPAGNMHINSESGIVEFLRPDGSIAEPGEQAEMVVTSFIQRTLPLIRYRIGDVGTLAENQNCPCGRKFPVVKYISGRESDVLCSTERGMVGSAGLSTALYKIPGRLKDSQIEQVGTDSFVFRYVPNEKELTEQEISIISEELYKRLGKSIEIKFEEVEEIRKGAHGKSQLVIGLRSGVAKNGQSYL
jgi:phenylacetate-CoA ligase